MTDGPLQTALRGRAPAALRLLETSWPALLVGVGVHRHRGLDLGSAAARTRGGCSRDGSLGARLVKDDMPRLALAAVALVCAGLWWGTMRNDALEQSVLSARMGATASARVVVTGPVGSTPFAVRTPAEVHRFGRSILRERVLLELPVGRAPPQGAVLERARAAGRAAWARDRLRRARMARASRRARRAARRAGLARRRPAGRDRWRRRSAARARGEDAGPGYGGRAAPAARRDRPGRELRARSGAAGRLPGERAAPTCSRSPVRTSRSSPSASSSRRGFSDSAGWSARRLRFSSCSPTPWRSAGSRRSCGPPSRGSLASLAWIVARPRDRWHALAVGALILLAWMPRSALEPGFQLSFAAVAAIFVVVPRLSGVPDAYPINRRLWEILVVAGACGLVTAPIVWLHFGRVALWTVPANVAAEPAMPPLVSLSLGGSGGRTRAAGRGDGARLARGLVRVVAGARRADRRRLAVGAGVVADGHRRRCSRRRRGRRSSSPAPLPAAGGRRRARVAGAGRDDGCLLPPAFTVLDAAARPPRHLPRRRAGGFRARRGPRRCSPRGRGPAGGGRRGPAPPARRAVARRRSS